MGHIIDSALFKRRGTLTHGQMGKLLVRGGGALVDHALQRHGWNGKIPVATTVATLQFETGVIRGFRFETRGGLQPIKFAAKDIWPGADSGIQVPLRLEDLGQLPWSTVGSTRNQTEWIDGSNLNLTFTLSDGTELNSQEIEDSGLDSMAVRFTILPLAVDKVALNAGAVPYSKEELNLKAQDHGVTLASHSLPTVAIKLFFKDNKSFKAIPMNFLPTEESGDGIGFGHYPLIEAIGNGGVTFPDPNKLEEEMVTFLQSITPTNNVSIDRIRGLYATQSTYSASSKTKVQFTWPDYRGPIINTEPAINPATG